MQGFSPLLVVPPLDPVATPIKAFYSVCYNRSPIQSMKRLHFAFGIIGLLVFILTGQVRRLHQPAMRDLQPEYRMMFISRHIYILGTDLTNLMVAVYLRASASPWARRLQNVGSLLLLASLILLALAFFREPGGLLGRSWESAGGLYALLAGALFHALNLRPESPDP